MSQLKSSTQTKIDNINSIISLAENIPATKSLAGNGYIKLAGGLIVQWGTDASSGTVDTTVTFPIAFPNQVFSVVATKAGATESAIFATATDQAATGFNLNAWTTANARTAVSVAWIAIGY